MTTQYVENEQKVYKEVQTVERCDRYDFLASETSLTAKEMLLNALQNGKPVQDIFEAEEKARFDRTTETIRVMRLNQTKRLAPREATVEKHEVLIRSRIPILIAYIALVLVVVIAVVVAVPGTSWESDGVSMAISQGRIPAPEKQAYAATTTSINTIVTEEGPVQVELAPYETAENPDTNWFDKICDWVSELFGG